jgi:hypothetical protein
VVATELEREVLGLEPGSHICLLYDTLEEQTAAIVPFMRHGIERGYRCLYVVDDLTAADVILALGACADVMGAVRSGALFIQTKQDTYLRDGHFEPDAMLAFLDDAIDDAVAGGYERFHGTGEMTWALGAERGCDRLLEYETGLTARIAGRPAMILCQYNRRRFPPELIRDVLRAHPLAIIGEHVYRNRFYDQPDAMVPDLPAAEQVEWLLAELAAQGADGDAVVPASGA